MPKVIITEPDKTPQPYRLKTDRIVTKIGRANDNDIIITTGSASTYHCEMKRVEGGFTLIDNNSTNGIKFEDTRYSVIDLKNGMTVLIGNDIEMEFILSEDEIEIFEHEDFEPQQKPKFPNSKNKEVIKEESEDDDAIVFEEGKLKSNSKPKGEENDWDDWDDEDKNVAVADKKPQLKLNSGAGAGSINRKPVALAPVKSSSGITTIIFMILAVVCFFGGLVVRHYQDHKTFIFSE